ncbi:MAG: hypothetical protein NZ585_01180 [Chloracidobacterium sp.]|nr:hypothetical protein [Chloracidobacterium sp.]MDW8216381.1 hypothetical protein [Acidobacteriota bacterium]
MPNGAVFSEESALLGEFDDPENDGGERVGEVGGKLGIPVSCVGHLQYATPKQVA